MILHLVDETPDQVLFEDPELLQHAGDRSPRDVLEEDIKMPSAAFGATVADDMPAKVWWKKAQRQEGRACSVSNCSTNVQRRVMYAGLLA